MTRQLRTDPLTGLRVRVEADEDPPAEAQPDLFGAAVDATATTRLDHGRLGDGDPADTVAALTGWRAALREHADASHALVTATTTEPGAVLHVLGFVPAAVARERERFTAYAARTMGGNLLGDLVQEEVRRRTRLVAYDDEAVVLAAFAPRAAHRLLVVPRRPVARFTDDGPLCAEALHDALGRLRRVRGDAPVTVWVRTAPAGAEQFCWRFDVEPAAPADDLAAATGVATPAVAPERAAADLRAA